MTQLDPKATDPSTPPPTVAVPGAADQTALWSPATTAATGDELPAGALLSGRFRLLRFLGRGGMGDVYEAEDLELGRRVALKTVRPEIGRLPGVVERFRREIQLALVVTHENVCRAFDVFRHPGEPGAREDLTYYTMELLAGETLQQRLRREGALSEAEALPIARQMAAGLAAAHRAGIVHRDFKSANVMLVPETGGVRAVITDFGLARGGPAEGGGLTVAGDFLGTPDYMAPEQVTGGEITPATDLYAFGIVLYEMVTGALPFPGDSPLSIAAKRLSETPPSPSLKAPGLSPRWEAVILRCLAREPAARFAAARDVAAALDPDGTSSVAAVRVGGGRRTRRLWLLGAATLALAGAGIGGARLWQRHWKNEAVDLNQQAANLYSDGRYDEGIAKWRQARGLAVKVGDRAAQAEIEGNLGYALGDRGKLDEGAPLLNRTIDFYQAQGDATAQANHLINLGSLYLRLPDLDRARGYFRRALTLAEADGNRSISALASYDLGMVLFSHGDLGESLASHQAALAIERELKEEDRVLRSQACLSEVLLELGRLDQAASLAGQAVEGARGASDTTVEAWAGALLARIRLRQDKPAAARSELDLVERIGETSQDPKIRSLVALAAGRVLDAEGRTADARRRLERALAEVKGRATLEPDLKLALGEIELSHGDRERGRKLLEEVRAFGRGHGLVFIASHAERALAAHGR